MKNLNKRTPSTTKTPEDMITGKSYRTKSCGFLNIVVYLGWKEVQVRFVGYNNTLTVPAGNIRKGAVKNPMKPVVHGVGFFGIGTYSLVKDKKAYHTWNSMLVRCYDPKYLNTGNTYVDCYVCDEWLNFQNFAEWFYKSNYKDKWQLDKDIINQGNKVYSPENCAFVDQETNNSVLSCNSRRGASMLGVSWCKMTKKFVARCNDYSKNTDVLGYFDVELDAHKVYKIAKYEVLHRLAKRQTSKRVSRGLMTWVIPQR